MPTSLRHFHPPSPPPPDNYETAIFGMEAIAGVFGKSVKPFWQKHGKELRALGVVFYINRGMPSVVQVAAFQSELIKWSKFKASKNEAI